MRYSTDLIYLRCSSLYGLSMVLCNYGTGSVQLRCCTLPEELYMIKGSHVPRCLIDSEHVYRNWLLLGLLRALQYSRDSRRALLNGRCVIFLGFLVMPYLMLPSLNITEQILHNIYGPTDELCVIHAHFSLHVAYNKFNAVLVRLLVIYHSSNQKCKR